jgi:hypothetical protein
VAYLRPVLSGVAALVLAGLGPSLFFSLERGSQATAFVGFRVFSPWCGVFTIVFLVLFLAASRLKPEWLRLLLFWTPASVISMVGFGLATLLAWAWLHSR